MIYIVNDKTQIPMLERTVGCVFDNDTTTRTFQLPRYKDSIDLSEYSALVKIQPVNKDEVAYYDILSKEVTDDVITLIWTIKSHNTKDCGKLYFNLKFSIDEDDDIKVYQTQVDYFIVAKSVNVEQECTTPPSIFEQAVIEATRQANISKENADIVVGAKDIVVELAGQVSEDVTATENLLNDIKVIAEQVSDDKDEVNRFAQQVSADTNSVSDMKLVVDNQTQMVIEKSAEVETNKNIAVEQAGISVKNANIATTQATIATNKANSASVNKDATDDNVEAVELLKSQIESLKQEVVNAEERVEQAEQRVITLMSTDTRSYFFGTIAERDAFEDARDCDRCSVLETRADYIYDIQDRDGDEITPEWIKTSDWDAIKTVAWSIITGKPNFATVAMSGSYIDLINKPNRYENVIVLDNGNWDYSLGYWAKLNISTDTELVITNIYNGAYGVIEIYGDYKVILPENSYSLPDEWNYQDITLGHHWAYSFTYDGIKFSWKRSVVSSA